MPTIISAEPSQDCIVIRHAHSHTGKQGFDYFAGISAETAGSRALCMHIAIIPPGVRGKVHKLDGHETAIYVLIGSSEMWYGTELEHHLTVAAGEFLYIPAGMPHLPYNTSATETCTVILSRTDPNEQESVVLLPGLERVHLAE